MQNILTGAFQRRVAQIAKGIDYMPENPDLVYDLIKSANAQQKGKVKKVMDEWKAGTLKSGSGEKVENYRQALAISLSEAGLSKGGDARAAMQKKKGLCEHGNKIGKCELCNEDQLKKEMDPDEGGSDGAGEASGGGFSMSAKKPMKKDLGAGDDFGESVTKGGEGSKGGKIIGHTKSGKPIYESYNHPEHKKFSLTEHQEAVSAHAVIAAKLIGKKENKKSEFTKEDKAALEHHGKQTKMHFQASRGDAPELDKAIENLLGIQDPIEKAFSDILSKGGKGSNKAGRCIGVTRTGKNVHVFKEANDYGDFEPVDHLEAHKIHLHHAAKVSGVAAVNSRIRAHDHEDLARIKQVQKENEDMEKKNQAGKKQQEAKKNATGAKKATAKKATPAKNNVKKALDDFLNRDEVSKAFTEIFEKGEISGTMSSYGDKQPLTFGKTGKQISAKLLAQAVTIGEQESQIIGKMSVIEEKIGEAPDDENCSYNNKTIKVPRYSYNYYNNLSAPKDPNVSIVSSSATADDDGGICKMCNQYNELSYRLVGLKEDLETIRLITENMESTKKYNLSIGQLTALGF